MNNKYPPKLYCIDLDIKHIMCIKSCYKYLWLIVYCLVTIMVFRIELKARWTFFRVKLGFECEFEISWSFGPWDLWTPGPWTLLEHWIWWKKNSSAIWSMESTREEFLGPFLRKCILKNFNFIPKIFRLQKIFGGP